MIVLGLDPGTQFAGYSVIEVHEDSSTQVHDLGVWNLKAKGRSSLGARLEYLYEQACPLIRKFNPSLVGLEKAIVFKNIPSSLGLSESRGVLRLALHNELEEASRRIIELSPTEIKKSATGSGAASKEAICRVLQMRFPALEENFDLATLRSDAFDALAVAWAAWIRHNSGHGIEVRP